MKVEFEITNPKFEPGDFVERKNLQNNSSIIMAINDITITGKWKWPGNISSVSTGVYTCIIQSPSQPDVDQSDMYEIKSGTIVYAAIDYVDQNFFLTAEQKNKALPTIINNFIEDISV